MAPSRKMNLLQKHFFFPFVLSWVRETVRVAQANIIFLWRLSVTDKLEAFPGGSIGKESVCSAGDPGSTPGPGRSAGEGIGSPLLYFILGLPYGSAGKESACSVGDLSSIPGVGRSPGEGKGCPLQDSGLENSMDYKPEASVPQDFQAKNA